jgi:predicted transcriptional regulator
MMTDMKQFIITVSAFLVFLTFISANGFALGLDYYGIDAEVNDDLTVTNTITLQFDPPVSHLDYRFDFEIYDLEANADFNWVSCNLDVNNGISDVSCDFMGMSSTKKTLTLRFNSKTGVKMVDDRYQYSSKYDMSIPVKRLFMSLKLPRNGILAEEIANESYFPPDGNIFTDGRHIIVYWERNELKEGDSIQFSVLYTIPLVGGLFYNVVITVMTLIVIVVMVGLAFYIRRSPKTAAAVKAVLNRDEKVIVDILNRYKGKIGQKVIVRESDFSKAKVSRLIKNLKERGIVDIEPVSGRENRVMLIGELGE